MINKLENIVVVGQGAMGLLWYHHLSQIKNSNNAPDNINEEISISLLASNQDSLNDNEQKAATYKFTASATANQDSPFNL